MNDLDIDGFCARLKKSAIDAWMKTEADLGPWQNNGAIYSSAHSGTDYTVSRGGPDAGEFSLSPAHKQVTPLFGGDQGAAWTSYFRESFEDIRATIDEVMEPWRDIPDHTRLVSLYDAVKQSHAELSSGGTIANDVILPVNDNLSALIDFIKSYAGSMEGKTMAAFKETFLSKLSAATFNLGLLAEARKKLLYSQYSVSKATRHKAAEIMAWVETGMNEVAQGGTASPESKIASIEFVLDLVSLAPATGKVAKVGGMILKGAQEVVKPTPSVFWSPEELRTCSGALSQLRRALDSLSKVTGDAEQAIVKKIEKNLVALQDQPTMFDLSPSQVVSQELRPASSFGYPEFELGLLTTKYMPGFALELDRIALLTSGKSVAPALARSSVGLTPSGSGPKADELGEILNQLLIDLSAEVLTGAQQLRAALGEFVEVENSMVQELDAYLAELDSRRAENPLDPPQPSPVELPKTIDSLHELMSGN